MNKKFSKIVAIVLAAIMALSACTVGLAALFIH